MLYKDTFGIFIKKLLPFGVSAAIFFSAAIVFAAPDLLKPSTESLANSTRPTILDLTYIYKAYVLGDGLVKPYTTTAPDLISFYKNYIIDPANIPQPSSKTKNTNTGVVSSVKIVHAMPTILELSAFYRNYITQVQATP